jgi:hypothetical protein
MRIAAIAIVSCAPLVAFQHAPAEAPREVRPHASTSFTSFVHSTGAYQIELPSDWAAHENAGRVNIGSEDGLVRTERGFRTIYGVIVTIVPDPHAERADRTLVSSTAAIVDAVLKRNPHQSLAIAPREDGTLGGAPAASAVLTGTSPVTGRGERAEIVCRQYGESRLLYLILVSPADHHGTLQPTLTRIRDSVKVLQ